MAVEIVEVLRRSDQGHTRPFICRGDDEETYFVKGSGATRHSQISEWIAGNLGIALDLPLAPFTIVDVPKELMELDTGLDLYDLGVGPAFGSRERQVTELSVSEVDEVPDSLQQDLLLFDWWIRNGDRTLSENGGNPNLFWQPSLRELVVIDHNLAFDLDVKKEDFVRYHVFRNQLSELSGDFFRREELSEKFAMALLNWQTIVNGVPEEWLFIDSEMTLPADFDFAATYALLDEYRREDFWIWP